MGRVIAVANQKGGVAKTTTVASLGVALAELGRRVLLVDLDPQACLTFSLGLDPESLDLSVHDVLLGRVSASVAIAQVEDGPALLPSTIDLAGAEAMLLPRTGREYVLRSALDEVAGSYDEILLDCAPSLGVLTINALTAADEVLIPLQCETLSHRGVGQLLDTIARRAAADQSRATGARRVAHALRRAHHARPLGGRRRRGPVRPAGARAADPEVHPLRRGAGRRPFGAGDRVAKPGGGGLPRARPAAARRERATGH